MHGYGKGSPKFITNTMIASAVKHKINSLGYSTMLLIYILLAKTTHSELLLIFLFFSGQMYPGWSARDNYAVHKKRRKRKTKTVDGNKQSTTPSTGGGSTTDDQDSHNAANDSSNDIDGKIRLNFTYE